MEKSEMAENGNELHVVFLPFLTPSHMIPLVDAARLFASYSGIKATIITTPANAALFKAATDHDIKLGHKISVLTLNFPSIEVGLPEGIENFSAATSLEMLGKVAKGLSLLQQPMENLILEIRPNCIFSDMFYPWTNDVAAQLKIPRLLFYPTNFISHVVPYNLELYEPYKKVNSDSESFLIPGLPDKIEMKSSQLEDHVKTKTTFGEILKVIKESELHCHGVVHDTIYELEPQYVEYHKKVKGQKYWTIGPLFHFSNREKANDDTNHRHDCFDWLDTQEPDSVILICFGSMVRFTAAQLKQIALALEAANQPFIWVVRNTEKGEEQGEGERWLPDGFEERVKKENRGLIIRSWAPQLKILRHKAIGGFITHCGWNSLLEAITCGVPVITWPLFAEQFYNEKLIEIQEIGVRVGADVWHFTPVIESVVGSEQISEAIKRLMESSDESKKIRENAHKVAAIAKKAVVEGGSSHENLVSLIKELKSCSFGMNN